MGPAMGCAPTLCPVVYGDARLARSSRSTRSRPLVTKVSFTMNAPFDPALLFTEKFAVGQPVSRKEDPVLLRGEGRYTDDLNCPGQLFGVVVRSRMAHGEIRSIDT